ncbi:SGNH/GDSL hydrolase family protein [Thiotrichales bacterium 19S3-11]|nr:SGNH/GDSL hydrolase family protein [Thiotrichales bacterium 19S3-11]
MGVIGNLVRRKSVFISIVIASLLFFAKAVFASAGVNIDIENRCFYPVTFSMTDENSPNVEQALTIQSSTKKLLSYVKDRSVSIAAVSSKNEQLGSLTVWLHDDTWGNYLDVQNLTGDIYIDQSSMSWHSWEGTPTVTVTTCKQQIDLSQSKIFDGVQRVIFFGDSLTDKGTLNEYTLGVIPQSPPYYDGMFSNGSTWAVQFSRDLNQAGIETSNYAIGGATAVFDLGGDIPYSLDGELETYQLNSNVKWWTDQDKQLVFIFIGANDYLTVKANLSDSKIDQMTTGVVDNIQSNIKWLINYGVKRFVIIGLPDLSQTPESKVDLENTHSTYELSIMHNKKLASMVEQLQANYQSSQIQFQYINTIDLFELLFNQTEKMNKLYHMSINPDNNSLSCWLGGYSISGLTSNSLMINRYYVKQPANVINILQQLPNTADIQTAMLVANSGQLCDNPENYIFWDRVHPTSQIHNALYSYIKEQLHIKSI